MTRIGYRPGGWVAVIGTEMWLLLQVDPYEPVVAECWRLATDNADIHRVSALLGARTNAAYALVGLADGFAHAIVRGDASVEFDGPDGTTSVVGPPAPGWIGRSVALPIDEVRLAALGTPTDAPDLALGSGVVLASSFGVGFTAESERPRPAHPPQPAAEPAPSTTPWPAPSAAAEPAAVPVPATEAEPVAVPVPAITPEPPPERAVAAPVAAPDPERPFANLFHETILGTSVRPTASSTDVVDRPPAVATPPAPPAGTPIRPVEVVRESVVQPVPRRLGKGIIDDVAWADETPAAPTAHRAPAAPAPRAEMAQPIHAAADLDSTIRKPITVGSVSTGPKVSAVVCDNGHYNPLIASSCRVCAGPIRLQDSVVIDRPSLGVIRLSTGEPIRLDRGVILGRAPGTPDGNQRNQPSYVMVADKDISRRHVEVRLDGWSVFVDDLHSSNGTVVTMPGRAPEPLASGGSRELVPGTVVHLSDTFSFVFETE
jgi:hypothetical protein